MNKCEHNRCPREALFGVHLAIRAVPLWALEDGISSIEVHAQYCEFHALRCRGQGWQSERFHLLRKVSLEDFPHLRAALERAEREMAEREKAEGLLPVGWRHPKWRNFLVERP